MRLLLLSLLTVYCCASVNDTGIEKRHRLEEALSYIEVVKNNLPNGRYFINTPPQDTEDCCCLTALKCFQANLDLHFNGTCVKKLSRSLKSRTTKTAMDFCNSNNSTQSTCQDLCHMHPKKTAKEFLQRLESLIQSMDWKRSLLYKSNFKLGLVAAPISLHGDNISLMQYFGTFKAKQLHLNGDMQVADPPPEMLQSSRKAGSALRILESHQAFAVKDTT